MTTASTNNTKLDLLFTQAKAKGALQPIVKEGNEGKFEVLFQINEHFSEDKETRFDLAGYLEPFMEAQEIEYLFFVDTGLILSKAAESALKHPEFKLSEIQQAKVKAYNAYIADALAQIKSAAKGTEEERRVARELAHCLSVESGNRFGFYPTFGKMFDSKQEALDFAASDFFKSPAINLPRNAASIAAQGPGRPQTDISIS